MTTYVEDVSEADFQQRVVERSREVPVVVDFWAPWCAPCRFLGPLLEREVEALGGRVVLAKVDTDQNPGLAQRFRIQGIPAVKAFRGGQVVDEFTGARDERFLRAWLAALAPSEDAQALARAEASLARGDAAAAEAELTPLLDSPEVGSRAARRLAQARLDQGNPSGVEALLRRVDPRSEDALAVPALERRLGFFRDAEEGGGEARAREALAAREDDVPARYTLASALAARGDAAGALEHFLEVVSRDRRFKEDGARKAMLALFDSLGGEHPLTREYRRRLQVVL